MNLKLLQDDEESYTLLYNFSLKNGLAWKIGMISTCRMFGKKVPKQGNMSDYEYFKKLYKLQSVNSTDYMLLVMGMPVTSVRLFRRNASIIDIAFITDQNFRHKGYATMAVKMVEDILFQNPNTVFTTINDMNPESFSSKIATSLGYIFSPEHGYFVKFNPNLNPSDYIGPARG